MIAKPADLIGEWEKPDAGFLAARRASKPGARWAVYQCHELSTHPSSHMGDRSYLAVGPGCSYAEPPAFCPGPNVWHAMSPFVGWLNLVTGALERE